MEISESNSTPRAEFVTSAAYFKELSQSADREYAVLGRSNVGKSSFINHVLESGAIARTSKKPGKTTLANLYRLSDGTAWVDLPGYGYAKASLKEKQRWGRLIADYCTKRDNLSGIIWLLDIRHPGVKADLEAGHWLFALGKPVFPVLTKRDKLPKQKQQQHSSAYTDIFGFPADPLRYSVMEHNSREKFWGRFLQWRDEVLGEEEG